MCNKRKILCIIQTPPPIHGAAVMNNYILNSQLLRDNYDLEFIEYNFVKKIKNIGGFSILKFTLFIKYIFKLVYNLFKKKPSLIYFTIVPHGFSFYRDCVLVLIIKFFKVPLIYHLHGKGIVNHYRNNKKLYDYIFKDVYVICLAKTLHKDIDFFKGTVFSVPNGIKQVNFTKKLNHNKIPNILYLSNFIKTKGVLEFLNAIKILVENGTENFHVNLVGAYSKDISEEFLVKFIKDNNLERYVSVLGPRYAKEKELILINSDIFVFPTFNDAFPLVLLEAMQFSLPIISSFEGAIPEIIENNKNGFLVNPKDTKMLSEYILKLISSKDLRVSMGDQSFKKFEDNYTIKKFENRMLETFKKIMKCVELPDS